MSSAHWLLALVAATSLASGQAPDATPSAAELTRLYVQHADAEPDETQNYTFLIHAHHVTYVLGRQTNDNTEDSEQIFIGGQPYVRRLALNEKPLHGNDLKQENDLYDKAVKDRAGLTEVDRLKAGKLPTVGITFLPRNHFVSDFRQEILGHELVDGHDCIILDLTPLYPDGPQELQLHIRLSLEAKTLELVQYCVQVLGQVGSFGKGSAFERRDICLENVWLPVFSKIDAIVGPPSGSRNPHHVDTEDFTNYRRFTVSSTIHQVPPNESQPPQ